MFNGLHSALGAFGCRKSEDENPMFECSLNELLDNTGFRASLMYLSKFKSLYAIAINQFLLIFAQEDQTDLQTLAKD